MNAAIYIRKSREDKTKPAHRLNIQRIQLPEYAKARGWTLIIYDDGYLCPPRQNHCAHQSPNSTRSSEVYRQQSSPTKPA